MISIFLMELAVAQSHPRPTARPVPRPMPHTYVSRPPVRYSYAYVPSRTIYVSAGVDPWAPSWAPAPRAGWVWTRGRYDPYGTWIPGYWRSSRPAPSGYVYVDGFWNGSVYVDGWYRTPRREGYTWVDTRYHADGSVVPGYWRPAQTVPPGYVFEPGLYDGSGYTDGFWRPAQRSGYRWVRASWTENGVWLAGYWMPLSVVDGSTWEPGFFDGQTWIEGRWVTDEPPRVPPQRPRDAELALPVE